MSAQVEKLLTPGEVAALFRVDPKTVTRWSNAGKLPSIKTLGGAPPVPPVRRRGGHAGSGVSARDLAALAAFIVLAAVSLPVLVHEALTGSAVSA